MATVCTRTGIAIVVGSAAAITLVTAGYLWRVNCRKNLHQPTKVSNATNSQPRTILQDSVSFRRNHGYEMPAPGEVLMRDRRSSEAKELAARMCLMSDRQTRLLSISQELPSLRLVQWNIERGYQLPKIVAELKKLK
eukprot:CAMPEP_0114256620 /NCGR_PEP_ID=MMETSP0058-20121206/18267_1 /TAXON_ID=36894 /ORGANISM="Pyramimonas parkeae, CCMP726" /LENGTH=136 /DNA_ID=CAMNT_0001371233 /DNA_START=61 /DNA_END=468 /DNA_ORIENTATION=-